MEAATENQGRILLVDDESAILRTFRYCLEGRLQCRHCQQRSPG